MLYLAKDDGDIGEFLSLLEGTRQEALLEMTQGFRPKNGIDFQSFVFDVMCRVADETMFRGAVRQTGTHAFPDIVAKKYFGIEVKMVSSEKWTSLGNSILESTREEDVQKIFMFFGSIGSKVDIRYRRYQDCLKDISVTHSPRYMIDMELPDGQSIFSKLGIEYDILRQNGDTIGTIKNFFRSQLKEGEELWWIDADAEKASVPIIRPFRHLSLEDRQRFMLEVMILFPEIFGSSTVKFERAAAYLATQYTAVSASLRDIFSAGGKVTLTIQSKEICVPQLYGKLYNYADILHVTLAHIDSRLLERYWKISEVQDDIRTVWKQKIDRFSVEGIKLSEIFEAGLRASRTIEIPPHLFHRIL